MNIYLPIAELSANIFFVMSLGGVAGLLSGMFGIGGGFILTPMLIFIGVPPAVSVATSTNMIVASSFSGFLSHMKQRRVDLKIGTYLIIGGLLGAIVGVISFSSLQRVGQIDLMITLLYVSLLGAISILMAREALHLLHCKRSGTPHSHAPLALPRWVEKLPWQTHFERSNVDHSILLPMFLGVISGILVGLLGVGGGFIMIPMMIYILRMPLSVTVGTSLFQIIFITAAATLLHAITTHTVDILLAAILLIGSAVGAQFGVRLSQRIPSYLLRGLMSLLLFIVAARLAYGLFVTPNEIFTLAVTSR
jgi:uncharacterized protein